MTVNGVVTQIGFTTLEPFDKRRMAVITNFLGRLVPINLLGLLCPKSITIL
jgi:hypothetical protein